MTPLVSGEMLVKGQPVHLRKPSEAIDAGIALIPENRLTEGLVVTHSVASNMCLPVLDRLSRWSLVSGAKVAQLVDRHIEWLRVKADSRDASMLSLSGGNQQKVVLAKGLATLPDVLVLDEPTAGIDIGSKTEIVTLIRDMAAAASRPSDLVRTVGTDCRLRPHRGHGRRPSRRRSQHYRHRLQRRHPVERLQHAQQRLQLLIQKVNAND